MNLALFLIKMDKTVPNNGFHPGCYKCAYCQVKTQKALCLRTYPQTNWRFIFYCDAHTADAEDDMRSILKKRGYHKQCDVLKQPVFAVLPENLVKKSPWGIGIGWFLNTSLWGDSIDLVYQEKDGTWVIAIDNVTPNIATYMPVSELKMSLPNEHHGLVDDLIKWLSNGGANTSIKIPAIVRRRWCCCLFSNK